MKFLFKFIFLPILTILAIPILFLALTYKSVDIPNEYDATGPANLSEMVTTSLDSFLTDTDSTSEVALSLAQDETNVMIKNMVFIPMNANYLDGSGGENDEYVIKTENYGLQGAWIRFEDDLLEVEAGAHVFFAGISFKTRLLLAFNLDVSTEEIILTLDKLTIGNLGLAWAFPVADWLVETIVKQDIASLINEYLGGLGTFDVGERSVTLDIQSLVEEQITDPQEAALVNSLLAFLDANEMLDVGFSKDNGFSASLALGKAYDDSIPYVLSSPIATDAELHSILQAQASTLLMSVLTTETAPYISFDELTLNQMMEYMMRDSFADPTYLFSTVLFDHYEMKTLIPYLAMSDDELTFNIPLTLIDTAETSHEFKTIIKINAIPSVEGPNLVIELNSLTAGEVVVGEEHIINILTLLGENNALVQDGNIVIEDFDQELSQVGMSLEDVAVVSSRLRLYVGLGTTPIEDIQNTINTVLDGFDYSGYGPDLGNDIDNLQSVIADPNATPEDIENALQTVLEDIDDLTPAEQEALFNSLSTDLENAGLSIEDILGVMP